MKSGDQQSLERPHEVLAKFPQHLPGMQMMRSKVHSVSCTRADKRNWAYPEIRFCLLSRLILV